MAVAAIRRPLAPRRLAKVAAWLAGIALVLAVLDLLGLDVRGWLSDLWDALSAIGLGYLLAGWALQTAQTTLTAFGWYSILRVAFPGGRVHTSRSSPRTRPASPSTGSCPRTSAPSPPC